MKHFFIQSASVENKTGAFGPVSRPTSNNMSGGVEDDRSCLPIVQQEGMTMKRSAYDVRPVGRHSSHGSVALRVGWRRTIAGVLLLWAVSWGTALAQQVSVPTFQQPANNLPTPAPQIVNPVKPPIEMQQPVNPNKPYQVIQNPPVAAPNTGVAPPQVLPVPQTIPNVDPGIGINPRYCPPKQTDPALIKHYKQFIEEIVDAEVNLDLIKGRTRLMKLKRTPKRIQIGEDSIAGYTLLSTKEVSLMGREIGTTVLTFWFPNAQDPTKDDVLSYRVRVGPDPDRVRRMQAIYDRLATQINCLFKDSNVCLKIVGDKIAVTGFAHDIHEATQILRIVRTNAPNPRHGNEPKATQIPFDPITPLADATIDALKPLSLDDYEVAGGPNVINLLRIPGEQQVMLKVTVAEVNRAAARSIGMNFTVLNGNGNAVFANNTGLIATGGVAPSAQGNGLNGAVSLLNLAGNTFGISPLAGFPSGAGGFNNLPAALDNGQVRLAISALRNLNYARSLAEPNLVTMNGQPATFNAGGQFPVPVTTGTGIGSLQGVSFVNYGVQLSFTPYITDRDRVKLTIQANVSSRDLAAGTTNIGGAQVPNLITRNFQTVVELREGQTLAVAGLIQNNLGSDSSKIPFFGDIPILNRLTGFDRITAGEQELVVLITPELVHPMEEKEVPPLPGSDLFEPTDLEFYLLGRIESHHPVDYRSPVRTDWGRIMQYHSMERMYLSGPHGYVPE